MEQRWSFRFSTGPSQDGPCVEMSAAEAEKTLLARLAREKARPHHALWALARFYCQVHRAEEALSCLRRLYAAAEDLETKAAILLAMGQTMENARDCPAAIGYYMRAFALEPVQTRTWYLIHNNLASSFHRLRHYEESEAYCRKAISIDPLRPEAHTNLGLALQSQGKSREAARSFIQAIQADAGGVRAFRLLENLLARNPKLAWEFKVERDCCRRAVHYVETQRARARFSAYRGWRKRWVLLLWRLERAWKAKRLRHLFATRTLAGGGAANAS